MGNFRQKSFGGNRSNRGFSNRNSGRPTMHNAICDECGRECEVPFKPTGGKPIYCNDCFGGNKHSDSRQSNRRDSGRFASRDKQMFKVICDQCKRECEVPFRPSSDKPVYCNECFGKTGKDKHPKQDNKQLEALNKKLDQILAILNSAPTKASKKSEPPKDGKTAEPKKAAKEKTEKEKAAKTEVKVKAKPKAKKKDAPKKAKTTKKEMPKEKAKKGKRK